MADTFQTQINYLAARLGAMAPKPSSSGDDTDLIHWASDKRIPLRTGETYVYKGPGIDSTWPHIRGVNVTIENKGTGGYVIDSNQRWGSLHVSGIRFTGGGAQVPGFIRNRYTGTNVNQSHTVAGCRFADYTGAAISHNSIDMPYWLVHDNEFDAATDATSIGVALSGLVNQSVIRNNRFINNRIHVKLAQGGNDCKVFQNDFLHFRAGSNRVSVWLVVHNNWNNAGSGFHATQNKHGMENLDLTDYRFLAADADTATGALFGDQMPKLAVSTGWMTGGLVTDEFIYGGGNDDNRPVYVSWTENFNGNRIGPIYTFGTRPKALFQFAGNIPGSRANSVIGPIHTDNPTYIGELAVGPDGTTLDPGKYIAGSW